MSILVPDDESFCYEVACETTMYRISFDGLEWQIDEYLLSGVFYQDTAWPPDFIPDRAVDGMVERYYENRLDND